MKYLLLTWIVLSVFCHAFSQVSKCGAATNSIIFNENNAKIEIHMDNSTFFSCQNPERGFEDDNQFSLYDNQSTIVATTKNGNIIYSDVPYGKDDVGPVAEEGQSTNCQFWDQYFSVTDSDIHTLFKLLSSSDNHVIQNCDEIPRSILTWPAKGNQFIFDEYGVALNRSFAEFFDYDHDGIYDPCKGDYPYIQTDDCYIGYHEGKPIPSRIVLTVSKKNYRYFPSDTLSHIEKRIYTFAFKGEGDINQTIFQKFTYVNKSKEDYYNCYFSFISDPDIGCWNDDLVGCDTTMNMYYCYNKTPIDSLCESNTTYNEYPPILSMRYLQMPDRVQKFARDVDGKIVYDQFGNKVLQDPKYLDSSYDTIVSGKMSSFVINRYIDSIRLPFYTTRNYFELVSGIKIDGTPIYDAGDNHMIKYAFPGDPSDENAFSMCKKDIVNYDQHVMFSTGPFILPSDSAKSIIYAISNTWGVDLPCPNLEKVKYTNIVAESAINSCAFQYLSGPNAPNIEADINTSRLTLHLNNDANSNNFNEKYEETILHGPFAGSKYLFEGYKVYQVLNNDINITDLDNPLKAKLISQSDIHQGLDSIIEVTGDAFLNPLEGKLKNGKTYYFIAVAYAVNEVVTLDSTRDPLFKPIVRSKFIPQVYAFTPTFNPDDAYYISKVTRLGGQGNPGVFLKMENSMYDKILNGTDNGRITYQPGFGPIQVKITDPSKFIDHKFWVGIDGEFDGNTCKYSDDATWTLKDLTTGTTVIDHQPLFDSKNFNLDNLGFEISIQDYGLPGDSFHQDFGSIGADFIYNDTTRPLWFGACTSDGFVNGKHFDILELPTIPNKTYNIPPPIGNGVFIPFINFILGPTQTNIKFISPVFDPFKNSKFWTNVIRNLNNVDIVWTKDKTKWSKCIVTETTPPIYTTNEVGLKTESNLYRTSAKPSIDENGNLLNDNTFGFSYFPGFAVDAMTGERLNIFFGESSGFANPHSKLSHGTIDYCGDLIFNPTNTVMYDDSLFLLGGHHYVYVTRTPYDGCKEISESLSSHSSFITNLGGLLGITWVAAPVLPAKIQMKSLSEGLIPNDLIIRLRANSSFSPSSIYEYTTKSFCNTENDFPEYEFEFEKYTPFSEDIFTDSRMAVFPSIIHVGTTKEIKFLDLPENCTIEFQSSNGIVLKQFSKNQGETYSIEDDRTITSFNIEDHLFTQNNLYFIKVVDTKTGVVTSLKILAI